MLNLTQDKFIEKRYHDWKKLEKLNNILSKKKYTKLKTTEISEISLLYRKTCSDLARAQTYGYSKELVEYLNSLIGRVHNELYSPSKFRIEKVINFYSNIFPNMFRKNLRFFVISTSLFLIPCIIGIILVFFDKSIAYNIVPQSMLEQFEKSYQAGFEQSREASLNSYMASFYIMNNIGIAFQCFATGIFFGLGSIYYLIYNGVFIGVIAAYICSKGAAANFIGFISTHSSFEITAIFISGAAGLKMGYSMIKTNGLSRIESLKKSGTEVIILVLGAASFLFIAAMIEGFWSPSGVSNQVKYFTGFITLTIVILYLSLMGRKKKKLDKINEYR